MNKIKEKFRSSIATRIVGYNSFVIIGVFFIAFLAIIYLNYDLSLNKEKQTMEAYLVNSINSVDNQIKDMARVSMIVYSDEKIQNIIKEWGESSLKERVEYDNYLTNLLLSMITIRNDIDGIYIFDKETMIFKYDTKATYANSSFKLADANWITDIDTQNSKTIGYKLLAKKDFEFVNRGLTRNPFENNFILMLREIKSFSPNERIGHIILSSSVQSIKTTLERTLDSKSFYLLLDENDNILCDSSGEYLGQNISKSERKILKYINDNEGSFIYKFDSEYSLVGDGKNLVSYYVSDYSGLQLIISKPLRVILKDTYIVLGIISLIAVLSNALMVIFLMLSTKKIVRPILILSESMTKFRKGDEDIFLPESGMDEVGKLTESFSTMMKEIKKLIYTEYESKIKIQEAELKKNEAQLMYLRSQVNPHFLYNTLDTIRLKAEMNGDSIVASMIMELVDFFRSCTKEDSLMVAIKDEVRLNKSYLALMKYRYPKLKSYIYIEKGLCDVLIPNFIIQPIIENALVHGLKSVNYNGEIRVAIKNGLKEKNDIIIRVSDNGIGRAKDIESYLKNQCKKKANVGDDKIKHVGITNIDKRIKIFYSDDYGIRYEDNKDNGVVAIIRLGKEVNSKSVYRKNNEKDVREEYNYDFKF